MRLNLDELGLRGGQRHSCTYGMEVAPITVGGEAFRVLVPEGVDVTVERIAGGYLLDLALTATVFGPCSRCLAEVRKEIRAEQQEFIPSVQGGWVESQSETSPFVEDLVVDLSALSREAVVLAMPERILCREECKGLCPHCGFELNIGSCSCEPLED